MPLSLNVVIPPGNGGIQATRMLDLNVLL